MSLLRKRIKIVARLNELLGAELGRTVNGDPRLGWFWSEDLMRSKRVYAETAQGVAPSYRTFAPDPQHPEIFTTEPLYEVEKLCPKIHNSYILCVWMESPSFDEWRRLWGDTLEWPKGGEYFPVSGPYGECCLSEGEVPTRDQTLQVIGWVKQDRERSTNELLEIYEKAAAGRKRDKIAEIRAELDNVLPAFDNVPGSNAHPFWFVGTTKPDKRISPVTLNAILPEKGQHVIRP